jgi:hypothetical protein
MQLPEQIPPQPELVGVMPTVFESGVYVSRAPLPTPAEEARTIEGYTPENTVAAIGMAALPESARHNQLSNLVYQGLTSEQYAERHNAFIARWTAQVQARQLEEHLEAERRRRDEDDEAKAKNKKKSGTKTLVGASK